MATDDGNFVDVMTYADASVEKPSKTDKFHRFLPGLTEGAADCSAPCGPIQQKFYVVKELGYGNS